MLACAISIRMYTRPGRSRPQDIDRYPAVRMRGPRIMFRADVAPHCT